MMSWYRILQNFEVKLEICVDDVDNVMQTFITVHLLRLQFNDK